MHLHVTLVRAPASGSPAAVVPGEDGAGACAEIVVDTTQAGTGAELARRLAEDFGARDCTVAGQPLETLAPFAAPLLPGAVIIAGGPAGGPGGRTGPAGGIPTLLFCVDTGPDAGQLAALARGTYTIGRSGCRISINDPALSRRHAVLTVADDRITLTDAGSANGTWVDGVRTDSVDVTTDSAIRLGGSQCRLRLGTSPVRLPARQPDQPLAVDQPAPAERSRLYLITALLPLVLGVGLALATGMWFFLAFSALSAVTAVVPVAAGAKRRRRFNAAVEDAAAADTRRRQESAPELSRTALWFLQHSRQQADEGAAAPAPPGVPEPAAAPAAAPATSAALDAGSWPLLRIGTASLPADVVVQPRLPGWEAPELAQVPAAVDLHAVRTVEVEGSRAACLALIRSLLLQTAAATAQGWTGIVVCFGDPADLPVPARFLPGVQLCSDPGVLQRLPEGCIVVVVLGRHREAAAALDPARGQDLRVVWWRPPADLNGDRPKTGEPDSCIRLSEAQPILISGGTKTPFTPDLMGEAAFDRFVRTAAPVLLACRSASGRSASGRSASGRQGSGLPGGTESLPDAVPLAELSPADTETVREAWAGSRPACGSPSLATVIGTGSGGPLELDLVTDGPHVLVAGTTGSGKSELLRSLVLGLALRHPPDRLSFLLVDFKGGSALRPLADLPHAAGLLTDLSAENVSRALVSLRAEVRRRERIFAAAGAPDIESYRRRAEAAPVPRLVVVIDEFRMLTEEVPQAMAELMRIAALGRSLGMHLVIATQRPQGAVSSDIRANVACSVALRVNTSAESMDVVGVPDAAGIRSDLPGRAYLSTGARPAAAFQSASAALRRRAQAAPGPAVLLLDDFLRQPELPAGFPLPGGRRAADDPSGLEALVCAVREAFRTDKRRPGTPPHRPLLDPLPPVLAELAGEVTDGIPLGLLDLPELQEQRILHWSPAADSHLAVLGTATSQRDVLRLCLQGLLDAPELHHLYILDGDGQLKDLSGHPHTGAYAPAHDLKLAVQILRRLGQEVIERLTSGIRGPAQLTVAVSGWGRWVGAIRSSRWAWAEDILLDIARDGTRAGVTLLIAGDRELIAGRFFAQIPSRIFLPAGCSPESLVAWPKLPPMDNIPGRSLVQGRIATDSGCIAQLLANGNGSTGSLRSGRRRSTGPAALPPGLRPFTVRALPALVHRHELPALPTAAPATGLVSLAAGVAGDGLEPFRLQLPRQALFPVLGGPGSGRTNLLNLLRTAAAEDVIVFMPAAGDDPAHYWSSVLASCQGPAAPEPARTLLLVDDADRLPPQVQQQVGSLQTAGAAVVFAAATGPALMTRVPLSLQARAAGHGIILAPRQPADGDFLGVRLEVDSPCPPGRAFHVEAGRVTELQVALAGSPDAPA